MPEHDYPTDAQGRYLCYRCGHPIPEGQGVDHSYRYSLEDSSRIVEQWACRPCDANVYDEAMEHLP